MANKAKEVDLDELYLKELEKLKKSKERLENIKKRKESKSIKSLYVVFGNHYLNQREVCRLEELLKANGNELLNSILDNPVIANQQETPATEPEKATKPNIEFIEENNQ